MMINEIVTIGDKIQLKRVETTTAQGNRDTVFTSQLLDIISENRAYIAMPIVKARITPLSIGEQYQLWFYTSKGLYQCHAVIINRYKSGNVYVLEIEFISQLEKIQRRQFYRLDCLIDALYHVLVDKEYHMRTEFQKKELTDSEKKQLLEELDKLEIVDLPSTIIDLSGGGAKIISKESLSKGTWVFLTADIMLHNQARTLEIMGSVIESYRMENRTDFFEHRIFFKDIANEQRELIIKYIFEEERKQRKREKGLK